MAFHGYFAVGRLALNDIGDLIYSLSAVAGQISAIKLKVDVGKIDHHASAGFPRLDISLFQFINQRLVLSDFRSLLIDGFLLLGLFYVLSLELIADKSSGTQTKRPANRRASAGVTD